jgi:hypothetical protein
MPGATLFDFGAYNGYVLLGALIVLGFRMTRSNWKDWFGLFNLVVLLIAAVSAQKYLGKFPVVALTLGAFVFVWAYNRVGGPKVENKWTRRIILIVIGAIVVPVTIFLAWDSNLAKLVVLAPHALDPKTAAAFSGWLGKNAKNVLVWLLVILAVISAVRVGKALYNEKKATDDEKRKCREERVRSLTILLSLALTIIFLIFFIH